MSSVNSVTTKVQVSTQQKKTAENSQAAIEGHQKAKETAQAVAEQQKGGKVSLKT